MTGTRERAQMKPSYIKPAAGMGDLEWLYYIIATRNVTTSTFEDNSCDGDRGGESSVLPVRTAAAVQGGFVTVAFIYYTVEHGDAHE